MLCPALPAPSPGHTSRQAVADHPIGSRPHPCGHWSAAESSVALPTDGGSSPYLLVGVDRWLPSVTSVLDRRPGRPHSPGDGRVGPRGKPLLRWPDMTSPAAGPPTAPDVRAVDVLTVDLPHRRDPDGAPRRAAGRPRRGRRGRADGVPARPAARRPGPALARRSPATAGSSGRPGRTGSACAATPPAGRTRSAARSRSTSCCTATARPPPGRPPPGPGALLGVAGARPAGRPRRPAGCCWPATRRRCRRSPASSPTADAATRGLALLEVAGPEEEQPLPASSGRRGALAAPRRDRRRARARCSPTRSPRSTARRRRRLRLGRRRVRRRAGRPRRPARPLGAGPGPAPRDRLLAARPRHGADDRPRPGGDGPYLRVLTGTVQGSRRRGAAGSTA